MQGRFKVGSRVRLKKIPTQEMRVIELRDEFISDKPPLYLCEWFHGGYRHEWMFEEHKLEVVPGGTKPVAPITNAG